MNEPVDLKRPANTFTLKELQTEFKLGRDGATRRINLLLEKGVLRKIQFKYIDSLNRRQEITGYQLVEDFDKGQAG